MILCSPVVKLIVQTDKLLSLYFYLEKPAFSKNCLRFNVQNRLLRQDSDSARPDHSEVPAQKDCLRAADFS